METVKKTIEIIAERLSNESSSKKDEVSVMQAMLNDTTYTVDVYGTNGKVGEYCPSADARTMTASIIETTTKIGKDEAIKLADEHIFSKNEASSMIGISKEFINTYLQTGRKLPLGGRQTSNVALSKKEVKPSTKSYPKLVKVEEDGTKVYEHPTVPVPGYTSVKVHGSCPNYVK